MCGRFTSRTPVADVAEWFEIDEVVVAEDRPPRYNVAPTDDVLMVASSSDGTRRRLGEARWGLVPGWASGPEVGARMINARAESLVDRPAFRRAFTGHRCLVPADGFYEWDKAADAGGARKARSRQPWYIEPAGGGLFAFAGLWASWRPPGDSGVRLVSCTVVTTEANATVARLHDRMPVVLAREHWAAWLDPDNDDLAALQGLLVPAPDASVVMRPVARAVGDVRNDGPELLDPPAPERAAGADPPSLFDPVDAAATDRVRADGRLPERRPADS